MSTTYPDEAQYADFLKDFRLPNNFEWRNLGPELAGAQGIVESFTKLTEPLGKAWADTTALLSMGEIPVTNPATISLPTRWTSTPAPAPQVIRLNRLVASQEEEIAFLRGQLAKAAGAKATKAELRRVQKRNRRLEAASNIVLAENARLAADNANLRGSIWLMGQGYSEPQPYYPDPEGDAPN